MNTLKAASDDFYFIEGIANNERVFSVRGDGTVYGKAFVSTTTAGQTISSGGLYVKQGGVSIMADSLNIFSDVTDTSATTIASTLTSSLPSTFSVLKISYGSRSTHYLLQLLNQQTNRFSIRSDGLVDIGSGGLAVSSGISINSGGIYVVNGITVPSGGVVSGGLVVKNTGLTVQTGGVKIASGGLVVTASGMTINSGGLSVSGGETISAGGLAVTAGVTVNSGGIVVSQNGMSVSGGVTVSSMGLVVNGGMTIADTGFYVASAATFASTLSVGDAMTVQGAFTASSLSVAGTTELGSTLSVASQVTIAGTLSVASSLSASGDVTIGGMLNVANTASVASLTVTGDVNVMGTVYTPSGTVQTSDRRLKSQIQPLSDSLSKVKSLRGVYYRWAVPVQDGCWFDDRRHVGLMAQDVQQVLPEAVKPLPGKDDYLGIDYPLLVPLLLEAIKELESKVQVLDKTIDSLADRCSPIRTNINAASQ
jgi:fibronectin-binding autotransporter adhesin